MFSWAKEEKTEKKQMIMAMHWKKVFMKLVLILKKKNGNTASSVEFSIF